MAERRATNPHLGVGCTEYVKTYIRLAIAFPADRVICDLCEFCHSENSGTRFRCYLTGEILPYHNATLGLRCPLDLNLNNETAMENKEETA